MGKLILDTILFLAFVQARAQIPVFTDTEKEYPIEKVYQTQLNESDGRILLSVEAIYPNGCYRPASTVGSLDRQRGDITLLHLVNLRDGLCTMSLIKAHSVTEIQVPSEGDYDVFDGYSRDKLGTLKVQTGGVSFEPSPAASM